MKKLYALVFISLLTISSRAAELASSFKEACALAEAQREERSEQAYIHLDLTPYYKKKYSPVYQSCLRSTEHPNTSPFSFVAAIGKDGRVLRRPSFSFVAWFGNKKATASALLGVLTRDYSTGRPDNHRPCWARCRR